jgi:5'-AMP-activated protein kinase, regulatory gamma subunit
MASTSSSNELLKSAKIWQLCVGKEAVKKMNASWSVEAATTFLKGIDCLSAPVEDDSGNLVGMIDVIDLMLFATGIADAFMKDDQTVESLESVESTLRTSPVRDLIGLNEDNLMWLCDASLQLSDVIEVMHKGIRRVLVGESYIVTQTDVARYLIAAHTHGQIDLGDRMGRTVEELQLGTDNVVSITDKQRALRGFAVMGIKKLSAVAIVDADTGALVGNLSASDVRGITAHRYPDTLLPALDFVQKVLSTKHHVAKRRAPVAVHASATLRQVFSELVAERIHRIYVVDDDKKPIRVISLTDILAIFCPYAPAP